MSNNLEKRGLYWSKVVQSSVSEERGLGCTLLLDMMIDNSLVPRYNIIGPENTPYIGKP